jgi:Cdc6-like AAA superfamily ATPase
MDYEAKGELKTKAAALFSPRTPIATKELFSGRYPQILKLQDTITQTGAHAIVYGERGVGKTSLANVAPYMFHLNTKTPLENIANIRINCDGTDTFDALWRKVFKKIQVSSTKCAMGLVQMEETTYHSLIDDIEDSALTPGKVQDVLENISTSCHLIVTLDEFDRLPPGDVPRLIADTIKSLSDGKTRVTLVIVGVGDSVTELIKGHESVGRHLVEIPLPRMSRSELEKIVTDRLPQLDVGIDHNALTFISLVSTGLPYFTHLLGQHAVCNAIDADTGKIAKSNVDAAMKQAIADSEQEMKLSYYEATRSRHPSTKFNITLTACALAERDDFGYFTASSVGKSVSVIRGFDVSVGAFANHLTRFCDQSHGAILQAVGEKHQIRYRFRNPLMQPFVIIRGIDDHLMKAEHMRTLAK